MFEDLTTSELFDFLSPLAESDRLSGKVFVDGFLLMDSKTDEMTEADVVGYDTYGFSVHNKYGCVRIKAVDERVTDWLTNGNRFEQAVAKARSQWYGIMIPGREYSDEVLANLRANQQKLWALAMVSPSFTLLRFTYDGEAVPNHTAVGRGNFSYPNHLKWGEMIADDIGPYILNLMDKGAARRAKLANQKGIAPTVGPR